MASLLRILSAGYLLGHWYGIDWIAGLAIIVLLVAIGSDIAALVRWARRRIDNYRGSSSR